MTASRRTRARTRTSRRRQRERGKGFAGGEQAGLRAVRGWVANAERQSHSARSGAIEDGADKDKEYGAGWTDKLDMRSILLY